jgi:hypothetical protein
VGAGASLKFSFYFAKIFDGFLSIEKAIRRRHSSKIITTITG